MYSSQVMFILRIFHIFTYYPSMYKDEVILTATIIVSLLATTVTVILYGEKLWRGETLTNRLWFAKLKPSKLVLIINNLLADLLFAKFSFAKCSKQVNLPMFPSAKVSLHMVCTHLTANLLYHYYVPLQHLCAITTSLWVCNLVDAMLYAWHFM